MGTNLSPGGFCEKCKQAKIRIDNAWACPNCLSQNTGPGSGLINLIEDPGHEAMAKILSANDMGPATITPTPQSAIKAVSRPIATSCSAVELLGDMLGLLNGMPLPKDAKQFKKLSKVKTLLEELLNENR